MARTPNYNLELIDFNKIPWQEKEYDNWRTIDAVLANYVVVTGLQGVWQNATAVTVGQKYVDPELGTVWTVLTAHTTASTGTFAADRTANSSYWESFTTQVTSRGAWATNTVYSPNDFVSNTNRFGVVVAAYTSGATYDIDVAAGNIVTLFDLTSAIAATHTTNTVAAGGTPTATYDILTGKFNFGLVTGATGASGPGSGDLVAASNLSDVADAATSFTNIKQAATLTATGVVELSTSAENVTGTSDTVFPSVKGVKEMIDTHGGILQVQSVAITATTGSATIPYDTSIPTISEGTEIASVLITPKSASNTVKLELSTVFEFNTATEIGVFTVWRDTTLLAVFGNKQDEQNMTNASFCMIDSPNTASQVDYSVRFGRGAGSATWYVGRLESITFGGSVLNQQHFVCSEISA